MWKPVFSGSPIFRLRLSDINALQVHLMYNECIYSIIIYCKFHHRAIVVCTIPRTNQNQLENVTSFAIVSNCRSPLTPCRSPVYKQIIRSYWTENVYWFFIILLLRTVFCTTFVDNSFGVCRSSEYFPYCPLYFYYYRFVCASVCRTQLTRPTDHHHSPDVLRMCRTHVAESARSSNFSTDIPNTRSHCNTFTLDETGT